MPSDKFSTEEQTSLSVPLFFVGTVAGAGSSWQKPIMITGVEISYKLDTGAQVDIIPYSVLSKMAPRPQLHPAATRSFAYGATSPLSVARKCVCKALLDGNRSTDLLF